MAWLESFAGACGPAAGRLWVLRSGAGAGELSGDADGRRSPAAGAANQLRAARGGRRGLAAAGAALVEQLGALREVGERQEAMDVTCDGEVNDGLDSGSVDAAAHENREGDCILWGYRMLQVGICVYVYGTIYVYIL